MLRAFALGCALIASVFAASGAAVAAGSVIEIPAGTEMTVYPYNQLMNQDQKLNANTMSNGHYNVGDYVDFFLRKPVVVDGWIAIPANSRARAKVTDMTDPGGSLFGGPKQGSAHFSFEWIQVPQGKIRLDGTPVEPTGTIQKRHMLFGGMMNIKPDMGPELNSMFGGLSIHTTTAVHIKATERADSDPEGGNGGYISH